jgi:predicted HTH transcriptional regulator
VNITAAELLDLIAKGEGSRAEFERECPDDDGLARTLCAFANTRGGWLIVGVDDGGGLHGCPNPKEILSRIRLVAGEDLKPPLNLAATSVRSEVGFLIAVHVNTSFDRPHSIPGARSRREILVRVGAANQVAQGATLNALRSHRTQGQPKDALESKILAWMVQRGLESPAPPGDASPTLFSQAANVGLRRASKAFISLERAGLLIGHGGRSHRLYALP